MHQQTLRGCDTTGGRAWARQARGSSELIAEQVQRQAAGAGECPSRPAGALAIQRPLRPAAAEVLDVRWANDDPNPRAVVRMQHEREVALRDAYAKVGRLPCQP